MKALVTGANSLVGANLARALIRNGYDVRAFIRSTSDRRSLDGLKIEVAFGDVRDLDSLVKAARGCQILFHLASLFSYYGHTPQELEVLATAGTVNAVRAAKSAKVRRLVLTSSSVVFGSSTEPLVLDEEHPHSEADLGAYAASKIKQDQVAFDTAKKLGVNLVAVCPTLCVGPHDYRLAESNAVILNYLSDPFRATWPGGCNIVSVEDVAVGHILVARGGKRYERYILGSQNIHWNAVHRMISELTGIQGPLMTATHTTSLLAAVGQEWFGRFTGRRPLVTREQAKMVGKYYWYSHERAAKLGYRPMPARRALARSISWLAASTHVSQSLRNTITLSREVYAERELVNIPTL